MHAFYEPLAPVTETPMGLSALLDALAQKTGLPRHALEYPVDAATLAKAAAALEELPGAPTREASDVKAFDRFIDAELIAKQIRPFVSDEQSLDEPLLAYVLGAWWGEWLVRHRQATWALEAPLRPMQWFPDAITQAPTIALHPFSQVNKKLLDPEADCLWFKAGIIDRPRKELPPFPLTSSLVDAKAAVEKLLAAWKLSQQPSQGQAALDQFLAALEEAPANAQLLVLAAGHALRGGLFELGESMLREVLKAVPGHRMTRNNLASAISYQRREDEAVAMLEALIAEDPHYASPRFTLATILAEQGRIAEAHVQVDALLASSDENDVARARALKARLEAGASRS